MDLNHDWKALNQVLFPRNYNPEDGITSSVLLIESNGKLIDGVVSNGRAFSDVGLENISTDKSVLDSLASKYGVSETAIFKKIDLDNLVVESALLGTNYYQQLDCIRTQLLAKLDKKSGKSVVSKRHFLLDLFSSSLKSILPRKFNVLIFIDERTTSGAENQGFSHRAVLLNYVEGKLEAFYEPDFSSLHETRLRDWHLDIDRIGEYLESRYILPCYAIFMHEKEWESCLSSSSDSKRAWGLFSNAIESGGGAVYPRNFLSKTLLAASRIMVYFSRL